MEKAAEIGEQELAARIDAREVAIRSVNGDELTSFQRPDDLFLVRVLIDVDRGERIAAACLRVAWHLVCEHVAFHIDVGAVLEEASSVSDGAIDARLLTADEGADDLAGRIGVGEVVKTNWVPVLIGRVLVASKET